MHLSDGYWEIIGLVKDDKSLKALTAIELGPKLGMSFFSFLGFPFSHCSCLFHYPFLPFPPALCLLLDFAEPGA